MRLDVADGAGVDTCGLIGLDQQVGLRLRVGGGERGGPAAVVERGGLDDGVYGVAVALGPLVRLEQDDARALAPHIAVGAAVEGLAAAVGAEHLPLAERLVHARVQDEADSARDGQVAGAVAQGGAGLVDGGEGAGAGGVDRDAGTPQVEQVRHPVRDDRQGGAGEGVALGGASCGPLHLVVVGVGDGDEHTDPLPGQLGGAVAGVLDRLPDGFEQQPLLRVHQFGLSG